MPLPQHRTVEHRYYVYILASKSRVLYIGVTNNLTARILQHRSGEIGGFTSDYRVDRLVYYEQHAWIQRAIAREKQLKRWRREKKVWLIEGENPTWEDLAADWGKPVKLTWRDPANADGQQVPPLRVHATRKSASRRKQADAPVGMTHR